MSGLNFRFRNWRLFGAEVDSRVVSRFLHEVADDSKEAFQKGMKGRKSGRRYSGRSGRTIRASAPGEYPAIDSGDLYDSIGTRVTPTEATIGTNMFYAIFLRHGTGKMRRRKMSDNALTEGVKTARHYLKGFVKWRRM